MKFDRQDRLGKIIDAEVRRRLAPDFLNAMTPEGKTATLAVAMDWCLTLRAYENAHRDRREPGKAGRAAPGPMVAGAKARGAHRPAQRPV